MLQRFLTAFRSSAVAVVALGACTDSPPQPPQAAVQAIAKARTPRIDIVVLPARDTIGFGEVLQVGAQALDARGRTIESQTLSWSSSDSTVATVSDAGIVIAGRREGVVTIRARVGGIVGQRRVVVRALEGRSPVVGELDEFDLPVGSGAWTYCASVGSTCEYLGLRDVRLVSVDGSSVEQTTYGGMPCTVAAFREQNPEPVRYVRCEYGPMRRRVLVNPMPGAFGMGRTTLVPIGAPGTAQERMRPIVASARTADGSGSFRTRCEPADFQFNDPLGNPGRDNTAPLHVFFGNTAVNARTAASAIRTAGASTCRGGSLDRSVYYMPALIDTRNGEVQVPADGMIYFRSGYNIEPVTIQPMPAGLVIMAGDRNARGIQSRAVEWLCRDRFVTNTGMIPDCGVGDQVQLWVHFPQCWDGRNLDSPDHRSHMAYPVSRHGADRSTCPPTHPVPLPEVSEVVQYSVRPGASLSTWRLSTDAYGTGLRGGLSAHGHWINGWSTPTMRTLVSECLNRSADCNTSALGDGTAIY